MRNIWVENHSKFCIVWYIFYVCKMNSKSQLETLQKILKSSLTIIFSFLNLRHVRTTPSIKHGFSIEGI